MGRAQGGKARGRAAVQIQTQRTKHIAAIHGGKIQRSRSPVGKVRDARAAKARDVRKLTVDDLHAAQLLQRRQIRQRAPDVHQGQQIQVLHIGEEGQVPPVVHDELVAVLGAVPADLSVRKALVGHMPHAHPGVA